MSETTTNEGVADWLRQDILSGIYSPGQRLVELELSDKYASGRGAIRAALVQLESESLVDRVANRGAVVRKIPVSEAIQITESRAALEGFLAGRAAKNATDQDEKALEKIIEQMKVAVDDSDPAAYASLNRALHREVLRIADHSVGRELVERLRNRGVQNQFRLSMMPGRQEISLQQHAAIVEAIKAGDEDGADAAMRAHLESVIEVLVHWVET